MESVVGNLIFGILFIILAIALYFYKNYIMVIYGVCMGIYGLLRALFFHLLHSRKGREFLMKIPIQWIQERASK